MASTGITWFIPCEYRPFLSPAQQKSQLIAGLELKEYMESWYKILKGSGRVAQRTLFDHKTYVYRYLIPFFGDMTFADLNPSIFGKFVSWAKQQHYCDKEIKNESVNKILVSLRMV